MEHQKEYPYLRVEPLKYTTELAQQAANLLEGGASFSKTAKACKVSRPTLRRWGQMHEPLKKALAVRDGKLGQERQAKLRSRPEYQYAQRTKYDWFWKEMDAYYSPQAMREREIEQEARRMRDLLGFWVP